MVPNRMPLTWCSTGWQAGALDRALTALQAACRLDFKILCSCRLGKASNCGARNLTTIAPWVIYIDLRNACRLDLKNLCRCRLSKATTCEARRVMIIALSVIYIDPCDACRLDLKILCSCRMSKASICGARNVTTIAPWVIYIDPCDACRSDLKLLWMGSKDHSTISDLLAWGGTVTLWYPSVELPRSMYCQHCSMHIQFLTHCPHQPSSNQSTTIPGHQLLASGTCWPVN